MKRRLLRSSSFVRAFRKYVRQRPLTERAIQETLILLADDAFHVNLRTHKLKGKLRRSWACSVGYDLRIVFQFVDYEGQEAILLQTLGTHDEVY